MISSSLAWSPHTKCQPHPPPQLRQPKTSTRASQVAQWERIRLQCKRHRLDLRVWKIPWRGNGYPPSNRAWRTPWPEEPGRLHTVRGAAESQTPLCRHCQMSARGGRGDTQTGRTTPVSPHAPESATVLEAERGIVTAAPLHRQATRGCQLPLTGQREEWTCPESHSAVCMRELVPDGASEPPCKGFRMKETALPPTPMTQASPLSDRLGKNGSQAREAQNPRRCDHSWLRGPISGGSVWALHGHNLLCGQVTLLVSRHLP